MSLVIKHDLAQLDEAQLEQYKRDVSVYIGLDPNLNGLDTIWMPNENGLGKSLVLYARRGTAEILRELQGIQVKSLTQQVVSGSMVFTATGENSVGRQEIAIGSKSIEGLSGKLLDDAIMTASTRATRRLTMQFTKLGILDHSEVEGIEVNTANPAAAVQLAAPLPPPSVPANNAPGKDVTPETKTEEPTVPTKDEQFLGQQEKIDEAIAQIKTPKKRAPRKKPNTVSLEDGPEAEVVNAPAAPPAVSTQAVPAVPVQANPAPAAPAAPAPPPPPQNDDFPGKPSDEQMGNYRKRVSVFTAELPASENMGSVQKMRAFITKMSGTPPQQMTVEQWEEVLSWFDTFVQTNQVKGLVKYINDTLGVK